MRKHYFIALLAFFIAKVGIAREVALSLTVSSTNETCSGNGSLSWSVQDVPAGASVLYSIYKLPDLTNAIATQSGTTLGGLTAGSYRVVATQTLNGVTQTQEADAVINNLIVDLAYSINPIRPVCGLTGSLVINVTQGTAATFEIISGPVIVPPQASNELEGLVAGVYEVRVIDVCGEGWVQTYTLLEGSTGIALFNEQNTIQDCDSITITLDVGPGPGHTAAYPMTVQITVNPPTGDPIIINTVLTGPDDNSGHVSFSETIPFFEGEVFSYTVHITDNCGNELSISQTVEAEAIEPGITSGTSDCDIENIIISNVSQVLLTLAPDAYDGDVPNDFTPQIQGNVLIIADVPPGHYEFTVLDICGVEHELEVEVIENKSGGFNPTAVMIPGCGPNLGGVAVQGGIETAVLVDAPDAFGTVPVNMTAQINTFNNALVLNNLPVGLYEFEVGGGCGATETLVVNIAGHESTTDVEVTELCGTFNLYFEHVSNAIGATYWLQKYNPVAGVWEHPYSGTDYAEGTVLTDGNAFALANMADNLNLSVMGQFRIIKMYLSLNAGSFTFIECYEVIHEFEFDNTPEIINVYSFSCTGGDFDVIVEALGLPVLQYRITQKNGTPFIVNNGTSNVFNGLEPATYNFEVRDGCNNIVNRQFKIVEPFTFAVSASSFCVGQTAVLSVPSFSFLNYQWYQTDDPSVILSTSATLEFTEFSPADAGSYTLHITSSNPDSCMSQILNHLVPAGIEQPLAGIALPGELCSAGTVDLFTLLTPPFDVDGEWESVTGGTLNGSTWDPTGLAPGTYIFSYTVTNPCGTQSVVTSATLFDAPQSIVATTDGGGCVGFPVTLTASGSPNYEYTWTLPDGSSAQGQTIAIDETQLTDAGVYTVIASLGQCSSQPATASVVLEAIPQVEISNICDGAVRWLEAGPVEGTFSPSDVEYSWTGPNGFSASGNPISIATGTPGDYQVSVTSASGCSGTASVFVTNVKCMIQQGISVNGDGNNDSFDLEGFDVANLQIFNRYGVTVYERANYIDEWRGQDYKDRPLPSGTYYYLIRMEQGNAETGWIHVIREQ